MPELVMSHLERRMDKPAVLVKLRCPFVRDRLRLRRRQIPGVLPRERQLHGAATHHHAANQSERDSAAQGIERERGHAIDDEEAAADEGQPSERYGPDIEAIED